MSVISLGGLFILGVLAAVIIAIVKGKPAVLFWTAGLFLLFAVASIFWVSAARQYKVVRSMTAPQATSSVSYSSPTDAFIIQSMQSGVAPGAVPWVQGRWEVSSPFPAWRGLFMMAILVIVGMAVVGRAFASRRNAGGANGRDMAWHEEGGRGGGWWVLGGIGIFLLVGLVGMKTYFGMRMVQQHQIAERTQRGLQDYARRFPEQFKLAQQQVVAAQEQVKGFDDLINEYDKPRIDIAPTEASTRPAAADAAPPSAVPPTPPAPSPAAVIAAARREELIDVAEKMIAAEEETAEATQTDAKNGEAVATSAAATAKQASGTLKVTTTPDKSVLVAMDHSKLRRYRLSYDQVTQLLDRTGIWEGADMVSGDRMQITAVGKLERLSELPNVLIGATEGRPVYLSDVATITEKSLGITVSSGPRPEWVSAPPQRYGDTLREVIVAGDYSTTQECLEATKERVILAVWEHLQALVGNYNAVAIPIGISDNGELSAEDRNRYHHAMNTFSRMDLTYGYIQGEIITNQYLEEVERSVGKMQRIHTQLEFTRAVDSHLKGRWVAKEQSWRVGAVSAVAAVSLGLVTFVWGLLKVDTMTKGYYSKRLFLGIPLLITGLIIFFAIIAENS